MKRLTTELNEARQHERACELEVRHQRAACERAAGEYRAFREGILELALGRLEKAQCAVIDAERALAEARNRRPADRTAA